MKVSFIVPIYKVEQYIHQCVVSILSQTYQNIEIILVDDGSPDSCPQICDEIAMSDPRIRVLHKDNGGLSDARNSGLALATGDLICFIDGDDFWIHNDDLKKLIDIIKRNQTVDFVGFNCSYYYPFTDSYSPWPDYDMSLSNLMSKHEAVVQLIRRSSFVMSACMKIIRRDFLVQHNLTFIKGQLSEDIPWFINLLDCCKECMFVNLNVYAYRQGVAGSITHNIGQRNIDSLINIVEGELNKIVHRSFNDNAKDCIMSFLAYEYCIILGYLQFLDKQTAKEKYEYLKQYKYLLRYTQDPKVRKVYLAYRMLGLKLTTLLLQIKVRNVMK